MHFVLKQQLEKPESEEITPDSQRGEDSAVAESKESRDLSSYISLPRGDLGQATKHLSVLFPHLYKGGDDAGALTT